MSSSESKKHAASARKLQKQREEGSVPNVTEITTYVGAAFSIILLMFLVPIIYERLAVNFSIVAEGISLPFHDAIDAVVREIGQQLALAVMPIVGLTATLSILASISYNKGILFALKPIIPDLNRISPTSGFKRLFGRRTWVELGLGVIRLGVWFSAAAFIMKYAIKDIFLLDHCGERCAVELTILLVVQFTIIAVFLLVVAVIIEMLVQKKLFLHEQKMTESEVKKEQKEQMGSNEVRQERNRVRQETAQNAENQSVNKANMCFYYGDRCIAVRYHPDYAEIPRVTAKAQTAEKTYEIRSKVIENGFGELEHQAVVEAAYNTNIGGTVGEDAHEALIDALKKLFGQYT